MSYIDPFSTLPKDGTECKENGIPVCPKCWEKMEILFTTTYYCKKCSQRELEEERAKNRANSLPETLEGCLKGKRPTEL